MLEISKELSPQAQPFPRKINPLRLMRSQVADVLYLIQIQPCRRELGNLRTSPRSHFQIEYLGAYDAPNRALVHGKEPAAYPIPALVVVAAVDTYHAFHLRLPPEARIVRAPQPAAHIEVGILILAVGAYHLDPRFVIRILPKVVVCQQFEADFFRARHFIFRAELHPLAAGADPILFVLISTHRPLWAESRHGHQDQAR